jgi:hypothetical protein
MLQREIPPRLSSKSTRSTRSAASPTTPRPPATSRATACNRHCSRSWKAPSCRCRRTVRQKQTLNLPQSPKASSAPGVGRRQTGLSSSTQSVMGPAAATHGRDANTERDLPCLPQTSADDTLRASRERHPSGYHESGFGRNPAAQAPLAAKLYFDCHDALRAERKRRYEV